MKKLIASLILSIIFQCSVFCKIGSASNAANIYFEVFNNMQFIDWEKYSDYEKIIDNGWNGNQEILQLINQETDNINIFLTSYQVSQCDFSDVFISNNPEYKELPWEKIRDITRLGAITGRFEESKGNFQKAYSIYKTLLKLSFETEQYQYNLINFTTSFAIKGVIYGPLYSLIKNKNLSKNEIEELINILEQYASFKINLNNVMDFEKKWAITFLKSRLYSKEWEKKQNNITLEEINQFRENYIRIVSTKVDEIYSNLKNAVQNNSEQRLKEIYDEFKTQSQSDTTVYKLTGHEIPDYQPPYIKWMDKVKKYNLLKEEIKKLQIPTN